MFSVQKWPEFAFEKHSMHIVVSLELLKDHIYNNNALKCLPYHKFKKECKSYLLTNQIWPCLYVLSLILYEILFPLFTAADYLNMTVSSKKALATLDTVNKWTWFLLVDYYL